MVASIFVIQGYETFRRPERVAPRAEPVVRPLAERIPAVPAKTEDAVRLNGAVQMVAGLLLALGRFPRLSALALAGTLVPTTAAGHRFWECAAQLPDDEQLAAGAHGDDCASNGRWRLKPSPPGRPTARCGTATM